MKKEKRPHVIPIRFSENEFKTIKKLAEAEFDSFSGFLRRLVLKHIKYNREQTE